MESIVKIIKIIAIILFIVGLVVVVGVAERSDSDSINRNPEAEKLTDEEFYSQISIGIKIITSSAIVFGIAVTIDLISDKIYKLRNRWSDDNDPDIIMCSPEAETKRKG